MAKIFFRLSCFISLSLSTAYAEPCDVETLSKTLQQIQDSTGEVMSLEVEWGEIDIREVRTRGDEMSARLDSLMSQTQTCFDDGLSYPAIKTLIRFECQVEPLLSDLAKKSLYYYTGSQTDAYTAIVNGINTLRGGGRQTRDLRELASAIGDLAKSTRESLQSGK